MAKKWITFEYQGSPDQKIAVAGTFNDWNPEKTVLKVKGDVFKARVLIPQGRHEYKFIADGEWLVDPRNPETAPNEHGTHNSVLNVN